MNLLRALIVSDKIILRSKDVSSCCLFSWLSWRLSE